jgi:tetratricopeptide (TPR) repeat protein
VVIAVTMSKSLKLLRKALKSCRRRIAVKKGSKKHHASASIIHEQTNAAIEELAVDLFEQKDYKRALLFFQEVMNDPTSVTCRNDEYVAKMLICKAKIERQQGNATAALQILFEVLDLHTKLWGRDNTSVAETLSEIGQLYCQNNNDLESLKAFEESLLIQREAPGHNHLKVSILLHWIGLALMGLGKYEAAMPFFAECLELEQSVGAYQQRSGSTLHNIASIYQQRGDDVQALRFYKESLKVKRAAFGCKTISVVKTLHCIAKLYVQQGKIKRAIKYYNEVLRILRVHRHHGKIKEECSKETVELGRTFKAIAEVYLESGATALAIKYMVKAARIMKRSGQREGELSFSPKALRLNGYAVVHREFKCAAMA